jgi:4-hydroxybenzoate polyprenyltransferase
MLLISGLLVPWPPVAVIAVSVAFGAMQSGILLVNNAEDLDEDEREGIRTASTVLKARGAVTLALILMLSGGVSLALLLSALGHAMGVMGSLPLAGILGWNALWLSRLRGEMPGLSEAARREKIRKQGKHVPRRIEAGAWAALVGAVAVFLSRAV